MKKTFLPLANFVLLAGSALALTGCSVGLTDPSNPANPGDDSASVAASGACDNRDLVIDEDESRLVLTGECGTLTITASDVFINVDSATRIVVEGSNNSVIAVHSDEVQITGDNATVNSDTVGTVEVAGNFNTLIAISAEAVTVSGNSNIANWSEGASSAVDTGTDNTIVAP